jgi:hypothetical protein
VNEEEDREYLIVCEKQWKVTEWEARLRLCNAFAKSALMEGCKMKSRSGKSDALLNGKLTKATGDLES